MKLVNIGAVSMALVMLAACSTSSSLTAPKYDPKTSARIRVFGQNAIGIRLYPGKTCMPWDDDGVIKASGSIRQSWQSFIGTAESTSIGMPSTERLRQRRDQRFAKEFYNEYVLNASGPVVISMGFDGSSPHMWRHCNPPAVMFSPEAGKDYEASLVLAGKYCYVSLDEIQKGKESTAPVSSAKKADRCPFPSKIETPEP